MMAWGRVPPANQLVQVGLGGVFWRRAPWRHERRGEVRSENFLVILQVLCDKWRNATCRDMYCRTRRSGGSIDRNAEVWRVPDDYAWPIPKSWTNAMDVNR